MQLVVVIHVLSNSGAEYGHFTLMFGKEGQRNEQRIITHGAVNVVVCVRSILVNEPQNNEQPNSTKQTKAQPNTKTA